MNLPCSSERRWNSGIERLPVKPNDGSNQTRDMFCSKFISQKSEQGLVARVEMEEIVYGRKIEVRAYLMEEGELQNPTPNYTFQFFRRYNGDGAKTRASMSIQKLEYFIDVKYFHMNLPELPM